MWVLVNKAERAVRPFTTKRNNSLHFNSDEGAEIAAVNQHGEAVR